VLKELHTQVVTILLPPPWQCVESSTVQRDMQGKGKEKVDNKSDAGDAMEED